jgi:non-specific serine/threonine protein kinase
VTRAPPDPQNGDTQTLAFAPVSLTSFVGREQELAELQLLLRSSRLVTLTGSGGVGKTRLAIQTVANLSPTLDGRTFIVELAPLSNPMLLEQSVLAALGGRDVPGQSTFDTLAARLCSSQNLLVLDNCEHLLDACAAMVDRLLRHCPGLRVLATSREVLNVPGECLVRVPSLAVPTSLTPRVEDASGHSAVQLFVERASLVRPDFRLSDDNVASVVQICRRLDGIPLAIELAAARMRFLSVEETTRRLDDRFALLTDGGRTVAARHQTLRATLDWSYDLLNSQEKTLLHRLAVFAGGGTLEAAEMVCAGRGIDRSEVVALLGRLVDRSLVLAEERGGTTRFRLLETIRAYALEHVDPAAAAAIRCRHRDWYLGIAEASDPGLQDPRQVQNFEHDYDNFRAALRWSIDAQELDSGLRLGAATWLFWHARGLYAEGVAWLTELLAASESQPPSPARAAALHWAAQLANTQGEYRRALAFLSESSHVTREIGYERGLGICAFLTGNTTRDMGDCAAARAHYEEALERLRSTGDWTWQVVALTSFGHALCEDGDYKYAEMVGSEGLELAQRNAHVYGLGRARYVLGRVAAARGDLARAHLLLEQALDDQRQLPYLQGIVWTLQSLTPVLLAEGDPAQARQVLTEAMSLALESGQRLAVAQGLEMCAEILAETAPQIAVQTASAAARTRVILGAHAARLASKRLDARLELARRSLGGAVWDTAWANGQVLSTERATQLALLEPFPVDAVGQTAMTSVQVDSATSRRTRRRATTPRK